MPTIDPNHCWLVLVDTPNSDGHAVVMMPAETFDIEAVLGLRESDRRKSHRFDHQ